jgi:hypothetical protein
MPTNTSCLCLVLLAATPQLCAQTTAELVQKLAQAESLDSDAVGGDGVKTETWSTYERLAAKATKAELLQLTHHTSPIVRGYAVQALAASGAAIDWKQLVLDHLRDTAEVMTFQGCVKASEKTGDVIFDTVREHLGKEQLLDVAEALVREKSPLYAREWALRNVTFRDGMLHELRKLAQGGDAPAAIALSHFHLAADVPTLIQFLQRQDPFADNCAFLAAKVSADPSLLPALRALVPAAHKRLEGDNGSRLRAWLDAIAAQNSKAAATLLLDVLEQVPPTAFKRRDLADTLAAVLVDHTSAVFDDARKAAAKAMH